MDFKKMTTAQALGTIVGRIAVWFTSAAFIWWGWNVFAWHFNLPQFGYMEVFAMRMALSHLMVIFWQIKGRKD